MIKTKRGLPDMTWLPDKQLYKKRGTYKGQRYSITAKSPEDVMEKIDMFKARVDGLVVAEDITVWQYIQRWFPARTAGLKPKTITDSYEFPINNYINPQIGNLLMKDVKPLHIDALLSTLTDKSSSLNHKVLVVLNQIFRSAIDNDIIVKNPCTVKDGGKRKSGGIKAKKKTALTADQQQALAKAVYGLRAELFVLLCLYAGLRREESLGLLWENVHLDNNFPHLNVRHTVTFDKNGKPTHSDKLKSPAAYRTIPLPLPLLEALRRRRHEKDSAFVIPSETTGREMSLSAFRRMWDCVVGFSDYVAKRDSDGKVIKDKTGKAVKVKKQYPAIVNFYVAPHLLRYTYITELCSSGMDIKKIQYLAGHETAQMTLDIYAEAVNNTPAELAPIVVNHFSKITKKQISGTPTGTLKAV